MKFDPLHQMFTPAAGSAPASSCAPFTAAIVAELAQAVPEAQRHGFYLAVGRRMAAAETLDGVDDLAQLAFRVNAYWAAIGWGEASVAIDHDAIVVRHVGAPLPAGDETSDAWPGSVLAVLEGAYDAWFRRLGSGSVLRTRAEWNGEVVELRHGR